jgi:hypothetical protein
LIQNVFYLFIVIEDKAFKTKFFYLVIFIKEGRRQRAGGRRKTALCLLPVTEGNKGLKPRRLHGAYNLVGV